MGAETRIAWLSEPDGPGPWWRDDRDGMPAHVVPVVSHGDALMMHVVGCLLPLPTGRRWARCVPPAAEVSRG